MTSYHAAAAHHRIAPALLTVVLVAGLGITASGQIIPARDTRHDSASRAQPAPAPADAARARELYSALPLAFEPRDARPGAPGGFIARGSGYGVFLTSSEVNLTLHDPSRAASVNPVQSRAIRMRLLGAGRSSSGEALDPLPGLWHYLRGNDPAAWRRNVRTYGRVRYRNVYRGIDVVHYGNQRQLEFDFIVSPGGDPADVRLAFDGVDAMAVDRAGDLVLTAAGRSLVVRKPVVYQEIEGRRELIAGAYVKSGRRQVRFRMAAYDATRPLVIDPVLVYGTYLGGSGDDAATAVAVDVSGHAYLTGWTSSSDFPEGATPVDIRCVDLPECVPPASPRGLIGPNDVFVAKIDPSQAGAASLVYVTVLGGSGDEAGRGIAVRSEADGTVSAYVTGETGSFDFPTTGASYEPVNTGNLSKGFVLKLDSSGSTLQYSTYLGAVDSHDANEAIVVDALGAAYVMGVTSSSVFPSTSKTYPAPPPPATWYSYDQWQDLWPRRWRPVGDPPGPPDPACPFVKPFLVKLDPAGAQIEAWTFLPGCGTSVNLSGRTLASNAASVWVTFNYDARLLAAFGTDQVAVARFDPSLNFPALFVVQPSPEGDVTTGIDVNQAGDAFVTGVGAGGGGGTPWLMKLNLGSGTYLVRPVPAFNGRSFAVKADAAGNAYVAWGFNFAESGHLLAKYDPAGALLSSIPLNGIRALDVDAVQSIYAAGVTFDDGSVFFPSAAVQTNAFDSTCGTSGGPCSPGIADAFLVKISDEIPNRPPVADAGSDQFVDANAVCTAGVTLIGSASTDPDGDLLTYTWSGTFGTASGATPTVTLAGGIHTITLTVDDGRGGTATDTVIVEVNDVTASVFTSVPAPITVEQNVPVLLNAPTVTDNCVSVSVTSDAPVAPAVFPLGTTVVTFTAIDAAGNSAPATTTVTVIAVPVLSATGVGTVTFSTSAGIFGSLFPITEATLPLSGKPAGVTFPFGFFGWTVTSLVPGQSITVTMTFPVNVATGAAYWKVINGNWVDATTLIGSDDGDNVLTITIADGGLGDADGVVNGQILDPGGVGLASPNRPPSGRMDGAGYIDANGRRHHFEFRANNGDRGSLQYEARSDRFVSTAVTSVVFSDDPAFRPGRRPLPTADTVDFAGTGRWNGVDGYTFRARAADVGEPGRGRDTFTLTISDRSGATVATVSGALTGGNIQSSRVKR